MAWRLHLGTANMPNPLLAYDPESEVFESASGSRFPAEAFELIANGRPDEGDELELAARLLELRTPFELDELLNEVVQRAAGGRVAPSMLPALRVLRRLLVELAARLCVALGRPLAGRARAVTPSPSNLGADFGLSLEGLSREDQEFEVARAFVRFAIHATEHAVAAPARGSPVAIAERAVVRAARRFAPGLSRRSRLPSSPAKPPASL